MREGRHHAQFTLLKGSFLLLGIMRPDWYPLSDSEEDEEEEERQGQGQGQGQGEAAMAGGGDPPLVKASRAYSGAVRENGLFEPFIYKNAHFTKTGSGQT